MKKPERRCPKCTKPIARHLAFCREDWFKIPSSLRDKITSAATTKNFLARANAMKAAIDWFCEQQTGGTT